MKLVFPNPSRSYDESGRGVRFWAYDQAMEVGFLIQVDALLEIDSQSKTDEAGFLDTFDVNRDRIHRLASKMYSRRRIGAYVYSFVLMASDL